MPAALPTPTPPLPSIMLCPHDLPAGLTFASGFVAIDLEMTGLSPVTERTCLLQVGDGQGHAWLVKFDGENWSAPNLKKLLTDPTLTKIIHSGRLDMAFVLKDLGVMMAPVFDTKIAARLTRPDERDGMNALIKDLVGVTIPKEKAMTLSDWSVETLSPEQIQYAADDVLYLHALHQKLSDLLVQAERVEEAQACFYFMTTQAKLDLWGYNESLLAYTTTYRLPQAQIHADLAQAQDTLREEAAALYRLAEKVDKSFIQAIDILQGCKGRVVVSGMGKSGHVGAKIAATFASTGTPAFYVHPGEASHGDLGMVTREDVVIAISHSGESKELGDILAHCKRFAIPLISITGKPYSTLGKMGDVVLCTFVDKEACPLNLAPMTSTTATLAMGDALAAALIRRKGFQKSDFATFHPGGKLGNSLQKVSDLMTQGAQMPVARTTDLMRDVVVTMTEGRLGLVGVVNNQNVLVGIITDGDLRRHLSGDLLQQKAGDVMSADPVTIKPDKLAAEAVFVMNNNPKKRPISAIFVTDEKGCPVGVLHIHACLRVGVV